MALQSDRFDTSGLPEHLHVVGVGPWQYVDAGHVGSGYVGSAKVSVRSDASGEQVSGIYDIFSNDQAAAAWFDQASSNFKKYSPPGTFRVPTLSPTAEAFCGPQASPANTTTCWFVHASTTGSDTATIPLSSDARDVDAVLQAMLTHLMQLGG